MHGELGKGAKILVVDDESANVKLLERILSSAGYTGVISTLDSRSVEAIYNEHQIDLILPDINMPLDPQLTDLFLGLKEKVLEIKEHYAEPDESGS